LRIDLKEAGKAPALNVVPTNAEADDVLAENLAAIVLELVIALRSALRRQKIRAYGEASDVDADRIIGEGQTRPRVAS